ARRRSVGAPRRPIRMSSTSSATRWACRARPTSPCGRRRKSWRSEIGIAGSTSDSMSTIRVAAVGDLHCGRNPQGPLQPLFALVLCGALTDHGAPDEARGLARELSALKVPVVAVLGNHDYEAGKQDEIRKILGDSGVSVLDGESCEFHGIGFAGAKGFCGGFG